MAYRFAVERHDYSDFASGKVFVNLPGRPAFPIRLASEIFQRCLALRLAAGVKEPCTLYDPCCGSAYLLATLAYWHWSAIGKIIGSDIDPDALSLAQQNLSLLTAEGLALRMAEIKQMLLLYGKASHAEALASGQRLHDRLQQLLQLHPLTTRFFQADATEEAEIRSNLADERVDLVISDIPYEQQSAWQLSNTAAVNPIWQMLSALRPILAPHTIVAIATNKRQKVAHEAYQRVDHFQLGKRRITFLARHDSNELDKP